MSVDVQDPPLVLGSGHGGMAARRAVVRWAWRLFRREWRQQLLVLALLLVAVAATTAGLGVAANTLGTQSSSFGTADHLVTVSSTGAQLDADVAALRSAFGTAEVIEHQNIPVPGSANPVDLRAQDPHGPYGRSMLRLNAGRYPQGPDEIAVTDGVAKIFSLHLGGTWDQGGRHRTVVGLVENPLKLLDRFALVAPGRASPPDHVIVLIRATQTEFAGKTLPDGVSVEIRGEEPDTASVGVLMLATIGLLFVGLLAVAGFTVMAQRRLRALGMLGAIGASHRHIRLVLVANGAVIGAVGALAGAAAGLAGWFAFSPRLESLVGHRIDRFQLPWLAVLVAVLLAIVTAVCAAWWPARAAARVPVVSALSARPVPPRPARRFAALGGVLLLGGLGSLVAAQQTKPLFIIGGVVATALGLLLLAPVGIAGLGRLARLAPLAPRLALRDLARYRARSSAALAAIALAVGIAAAVALGAAVSVAKAAAPTGGNLPADQLIVWLSENALNGPVPSLTPAQADNARLRVDAIAADLHATSVLPLQAAVDPNAPQVGGSGGREPMQLGKPHPITVDGRQGFRYSSADAVPLFVATSELLGHYGIDPTSIDAGTDIVTSRADLDSYDLFPGRYRDWRPRLQHAPLPTYTSLPGTLLTTHAVQSLHLTPIPAGWLVRAPRPLTQAQIDRAQRTALAAGLSVETRPTGADLARLADNVTGTGIAVALGVLAMTVGLIRSETARDLRTLTAAGARRGTRRALTAATAGALALLGAVIGTAGAYLALLAWYHREPHWLGHVPVLDLAAILVGLPVVAYAGGWLLAGKEAPTLARQPLD
ncbi:FtsX-like permease family protein [Micromonospora inositola]|uniref:Putative ABC transport system permease protein n=1 Tax=Micromonospora inositola TaxID=47865 RepID=A0A1C5H0Q5_9ACTN|nr:FtsX-like permease family protein [Micromonospora inositola]SCG39568.1 putative ABC transport system permease protein [Micromonospora inositola]